MDRTKHAIPIIAVGLGQCGGNLASALGARGYPAFAINAAAADMRRLEHVSEARRISISIEGSDGAGKDPELGAASVRAHASEIARRIQSCVTTDSVILVCAGLGGGTGSAAAALVEALKPLSVSIAGLVTVPANHETGLSKINAVRAIDELIGADIDALLAVDNERVFEAFGSHRLDRYLAVGNDRIVGMLDAINTMHAAQKGGAIRGFDRMDLQRTFMAGGFTRTAEVRFGASLPPDPVDITETLAKALENGDLFAPGADLAQARFVSVLLCAPKAVLATCPPTLIQGLRGELRSRTGGAAVYAGIFELEQGEAARAYAVVGGLGYPSSLGRLLTDAVEEGKNLSARVEESIGNLDTQGFDDLESALNQRWRARSAPSSTPSGPPRSETLRPMRAERSQTPLEIALQSARMTAQNAPAPEAPQAPAFLSAPLDESPVAEALLRSGIRTAQGDPVDDDRTQPRHHDLEAEGDVLVPAPRQETTQAIEMAAVMRASSHPPKSVGTGNALRLEEQVRRLVARGRSAVSDAETLAVAGDVAALYESPDVAVRMAALTAAVLIGTPNAMSMLKEALSDSANEVRRKAMLLLSAQRNRGGARRAAT